MKCPSCGAEIPDNSKFCSECGTKIENTSNYECDDDSKKIYEKIKKHNKIVKIQGISIICISCFGIGILVGAMGFKSQPTNTVPISSASSDTTVSDIVSLPDTTDSTDTDDIVSTPVEPIIPTTKNLSTGQYTVGTDIPAGTYDITLVSGDGNVFIGDSVNEIFGHGQYQIASYRNATLIEGDSIKIDGAVTVCFTSKWIWKGVTYDVFGL